MIRVDVLGPLAVTIDGEPIEVGGPQPQAVLLSLVHHLGQVVTLDSLIDTLWGDKPPRSARNSLQVKVSTLRNALGPTFDLRTVPTGYVLEPTSVGSDLTEFEDLCTEAAVLLETDPTAAATAATTALALWRGDPARSLPDTDLFHTRSAALTDRRTQARAHLIDARLRLGQHVECCAEAAALADEHPFREDIRSLHLIALYRSARQTEALRAFRTTRELLVEELGIEPGSALQTLHRRILEQDETLHLDTTPPTPITAAAPQPRLRRDNLGPERDAFIARPEIDEIATSLEPGRPVVVVGTGGIGKSRCLDAVARRSRDNAALPDGVWVVDLAPLREGADDIGATVAAAMGLGRLTDVSATHDVVSYLAGRQALLVLDNCEHVADAAARLITTVTDGAPGTAVLAASRVRLQVFPETVVRLDSLSDDAALELLTTRIADAGGHQFPLDDCIALCAMLDNYPLAIELAAARTTTMSAAEIVTRLARQPSLLRQRNSRDGSGTRQYADLATALDWSLSQLSLRAQETLTRAAVFVSDFDLAAAEAVLSCMETSETDVVDDLGELVEHHLVSREHSRARFRLLEPIRQHLRSGVPSETEQRYGEHFAALTNDAIMGTQGPHEAMWWQRLRAELPHVEEMIRWAADRGDIARLDPMFTGLVSVIIDYPVLGGAAVDALERLGRAVVDVPGVAVSIAVHCLNMDRTDRCTAILDEIEPIISSPHHLTAYYSLRALTEPHQPSWIQLWHEAAVNADNRPMIARAKILQWSDDMLIHADELGNPSIQVLARTILSSKTTDGTLPEARENKSETYRLAMASDNQKTILTGLQAMAYQHCWDNDPRRAGPFAIEMLERVMRLRSPGSIWHNLEGIASMLAILRIEPSTSATLWAAIDAHTTFATRYRNPRWPAAVAAKLTEDEKTAAQREGLQLSADEAARLALKAAENLAAR